MKKYKKNITIKIACVFTELMICFVPMFLIMVLFLSPERLTEIFNFIVATLVFIGVLNLFLYVIALIGRLFIKTTYIIEGDDLIIRRDSDEKIVDLKSVNAIVYDLGGLSKHGGNPSELILFDRDYKDLVTIKNPPLMMVAHIKKKCNSAKTSYYNSKRFLFFLLLSSVIAVAISLIAIISK